MSQEIIESKVFDDDFEIRIVQDEEGVSFLMLGKKDVRGGEVYGGEWSREIAKELTYIRALFEKIDSAETFRKMSILFRQEMRNSLK